MELEQNGLAIYSNLKMKVEPAELVVDAWAKVPNPQSDADAATVKTAAFRLMKVSSIAAILSHVHIMMFVITTRQIPHCNKHLQ